MKKKNRNKDAKPTREPTSKEVINSLLLKDRLTKEEYSVFLREVVKGGFSKYNHFAFFDSAKIGFLFEFFLCAAISLFFFFKVLNEKTNLSFLNYVLFSWIIMSMYNLHRVLETPETLNNVEKNKWTDRVGHRLSFFYLLNSLLCIINIYLYHLYGGKGIGFALPIGVISGVINSGFSFLFSDKACSNIFLYISTFGGLVYTFFLFIVISKPSMILNKLFTNIGSYFSHINIVFLFIGLFTVKADMSINGIWQLTIIGFITSLVTYHSLFLHSNFNINTISGVALTFISPERLFFNISKQWTNITDSKDAILMIEELIKKDRYGVLNELNKELTQRFPNKRSKSITILYLVLSSILTATIVAVYEGIVQNSKPFDSFRQFVCSHISWLCI